MTKRDIIYLVLDGQKPPYVPWSFSFTVDAAEKLRDYYGVENIEDIESPLENHILGLGSDIGFFEDLGNDIFQDYFGVKWDRRADKDIGIPAEVVLKEPTLTGYEFPDPTHPRFFADIEAKIEKYPDRFRLFRLGFSLYERAWTLRGMENLLMDFVMHPDFVHQLLGQIADYNIAQVRAACQYDIDAVYFGDDWGQQKGLIMGPKIWRQFIKPQLERMYNTVRKECGKYQFIHSCGQVDSLFDDLVTIGLNCFNPFQPEVMDVCSLLPKYRGRLTFHGGLSTQRTLPFGTVEDVRNETRRLLELGAEGSYILSPAHAVEGDVPLENMLAFIEETQNQPAYRTNFF
jgi:uroporphyrinogen decarboxylase